MCIRKVMEIKSVSSNAPKLRFIPCGVCPECRNLKKADWAFRLRVEFEAFAKRGWQVGFVTLTYKNKCLPRVPRFWLNGRGKAHFSGKPMPACFSRDDINKFIKSLTNWLYREKGLSDSEKLRFFVASEFGSDTKRPHYHALFCFPPSVDARDFFARVKSGWKKKGFVIPKDFEGGIDKHGKVHKPFVVDCLRDACKYCAKYVAKDLSFFESFDTSMFYRCLNLFDGTTERVNQFFPFHSQSKSIGSAFLAGLSDVDKLRYYLDGVSFVGEHTLRQLPVYIKNKIVYNNYYVVDSEGKRCCRRVASDFFERFAPLIYARKLKSIEDLTQQWLDGSLNRFYTDSERHFCESFRRKCRLDAHRLAGDYLAYGGCDPMRCYDVERMRFWYSRYVCVTDGVEVSDVDFSIYDDKGVFPCNLVPFDYLEDLNRFYLINQKYEVVRSSPNDELLRQNEYMIENYRDRYFNDNLFRINKEIKQDVTPRKRSRLWSL